VVTIRLCLAAALACAASLPHAGEVVVAVPVSLQPYFLPFQGTGLAYDIIQAAFAARGHAVRPLYVSGRTLTNLIADDSRADCIPMVSPGAEHGWSPTRSIRLFHDFAITRPGIQVTEMEDLSTKRVLAYDGAKTYLGERFRAAVNDNPNYREIYNHRAQVLLLLQGSVDVIIADRLLANWYLNYLHEQDGKDTDVVFHDLFEPISHDFICRRAELSAEFSAGLSQIAESGELGVILRRYGVDNPESVLDPRPQDPGGPG
jgi:polar amino acid transport system substrate-binding protein